MCDKRRGTLFSFGIVKKVKGRQIIQFTCKSKFVKQSFRIVSFSILMIYILTNMFSIFVLVFLSYFRLLHSLFCVLFLRNK